MNAIISDVKESFLYETARFCIAAAAVTAVVNIVAITLLLASPLLPDLILRLRFASRAFLLLGSLLIIGATVSAVCRQGLEILIEKMS